VCFNCHENVEETLSEHLSCLNVQVLIGFFFAFSILVDRG
jgi:hypothetical protein